MPQQRAVGIDTARPVPRAVAIRTLLVSNALYTVSKGMNLRTTPLYFSRDRGLLDDGARGLRLLTGLLAVSLMLFFGERSVAIVRQSRLLWLNIPGSREAVRSEIEKVLLAQRWALAVARDRRRRRRDRGLTARGRRRGRAVLRARGERPVPRSTALTSPWPPCRAWLTYFWGFGSMVLLQLVLLLRPEPSLAAVAVVAAVELAGDRVAAAARDPALAHGRLAAAAASTNARRRAAIAVTIERQAGAGRRPRSLTSARDSA